MEKYAHFLALAERRMVAVGFAPHRFCCGSTLVKLSMTPERDSENSTATSRKQTRDLVTAVPGASLTYILIVKRNERASDIIGFETPPSLVKPMTGRV